MITENILREVLQERKRQDDKFGEQNHGYGMWSSILMEEVGEAAKEAVELHYYNDERESVESVKQSMLRRLRTELVQVAAVAVAWIECIDRRIKNNE